MINENNVFEFVLFVSLGLYAGFQTVLLWVRDRKIKQLNDKLNAYRGTTKGTL